MYKRIKRMRKGYKIAKGIGKGFNILIAIAGPAMSIFLLVDGFLNKDDANKKLPVEPIGVTYE